MPNPNILYHCPCLTNSLPPPPNLPSSSYSFHQLDELYFCEECDQVRCSRCISVEVSGYYCPNCLFEVPSASVRAEKNRCARNCFSCPNCRNTLLVVPSDPPDTPDGRPGNISSTVGEPPFFLYCNYCRWDSTDVGITFEKPTGLAAQLQKFEDSAADSLEFDRLKDHFEPVVRAALASSVSGGMSLSGLGSSTSGTTGPTIGPSTTAISQHLHSNSITAAASAALNRDIPGVGRYHHNPLMRSHSGGARALSSSFYGGSGKDRSVNRDEMPEYKSRIDIAAVGVSSYRGGGGEGDVEFMKRLESMNQVASLEQRWESSWSGSLLTMDLRPHRIPLQSKRTKRCPTCTHILIKPEQKAQSVRFKIKLVASNYLPTINVIVPSLAVSAPERKPGALNVSTLGRSASIPQGAEEEAKPTHFLTGKTYPFQLSLTNPLYDPIQVRLSVQRVHVSTTQHAPTSPLSPASDKAKAAARPPFAISLPTSAFPIAAYAEAWEYDDDEDDEEMFGDDDIDNLLAGRALDRDKDRYGKSKGGAKSASKTIGILDKKGNRTVVGGEVVIGKEARGNVKFNMLVSYTYRADESAGDPAGGGVSATEHGSPTKMSRSTSSNSAQALGMAAGHETTKTFAFYTVVDLGPISNPRDGLTIDPDF